MRAFDLAASVPWAIRPDALQVILDLAARAEVAPEIVAAAMTSGSPQAVAARLGRPLDNARTVAMHGSVAVVPVGGPIFRYANLFSEVSGATSAEVLARDLTAALDDPAVTAILLEIDSPGGEVSGMAELAGMIRAGDARKPVHAYVDHLGASAAYWLASAAGRVTVAPTAIVGNIGVVSAMRNPKKADSQVVEFVSSQSPRKRADISTETGRAQVQAVVDALADVFVADVARYRGVDVETVLADFGQGDVFVGEAASRAGLVDGVGTFESAVADVASEADRRAGSPFRVRSATMGMREQFFSWLDGLDASASADQEAAIVTENLDRQPSVPADAQPQRHAALPADLADLQAQNDALKAELAATKTVADANAEQSRLLADRVKAMETAARRKRFTDEVMGKSDANGNRWFGDVEQQVALLEHLADTAGEDSALFADFVARQRALAEQVRSSALFAEIGAGSADGSGSATAWDRVEAAARKLMDADGGLSKPAAIDRVLMTDKALAAEYAAEQRPWANGGRR